MKFNATSSGSFLLLIADNKMFSPIPVYVRLVVRAKDSQDAQKFELDPWSWYFMVLKIARKPSFNHLLENIYKTRSEVLERCWVCNAHIMEDIERSGHDARILVAQSSPKGIYEGKEQKEMMQSVNNRLSGGLIEASHWSALATLSTSIMFAVL